PRVKAIAAIIAARRAAQKAAQGAARRVAASARALKTGDGAARGGSGANAGSSSGVVAAGRRLWARLGAVSAVMARAATRSVSAAQSGLEALYDPFKASGAREEDVPPRALRPFFGWAYRGMGPVLALLLLSSIAVGFTEAAVLAMLGQLVDIIAGADPGAVFSENAAFFWIFALLIVVVRPLAALAQAACTSLIVNPGLAPRVIWGLHRHLLGQSLRFFEDDFAGRLAQKEMQTANAINSVTTDVASAIGMLAAFIIGMAAALGLADWRLGAATLLWAAGYVAVLAWTLPPIRAAAKARAEARSRVTGQLVDSFSNIKTVKLFAHAGREEAAAETALRRYRDSSLTFGRRVMRLRVALALLNAVLMGGLVWAALALWSQGLASVGLAAGAGALAFRATGMSNWIAFTALSVFSELGVAEDGVESLTKEHEVRDRPDAAGFPAPTRRASAEEGVPGAEKGVPSAEKGVPSAEKGVPSAEEGVAGAEGGAAPRPPSVVFEGVGFRYGGAAERGEAAASPFAPDQPLAGVEALDLHVEPGETIGLVGPSGAGKSTLISLLLRLYEPQRGRILVDGVDIASLSQDALRAQIGVITQEAAMFNRSALANIRYGRPEANEAEAIEAARRAQADAFIRELKDGAGRAGYEAHLGERGVKLSGGQRQRIALARVLLKDAPLLILDEATSALDSAVENEILNTIEFATAEKTVIAIAHRLSTIARMDRIVVMERGRIIEQGSHRALIAAGGLYALLWERQSGGFIGGAAPPEAAE
ncbi:MAG: ABC transporter ATP-binding protein, partial [Pseudomonadota bacterium]